MAASNAAAGLQAEGTRASNEPSRHETLVPPLVDARLHIFRNKVSSVQDTGSVDAPDTSQFDVQYVVMIEEIACTVELLTVTLDTKILI